MDQAVTVSTDNVNNLARQRDNTPPLAIPDVNTDPLVEQNERLEKAYKNAIATIAEQDDMLGKLLSESLIFGTVVGVSAVKPSRDLYVPGDMCVVLDCNSQYYKSAGRVIEVPGEDGMVPVKLIGSDVVDYFSIGLEGSPPVQVKLLGKDDGNRVMVQAREDLYDVCNVPNLFLGPGDVVKLHPKTKQIVDRSLVTPPGDVCRVKSVLDNGRLEVEVHGHNKVVFPGFFESILDVGDRVCLDMTNVVVIQKLPPEFSDQYGLRDQIKRCWSDIGGCHEAKEELIEALELPFKFPDVFAHYRKEPLKGALLYGPPGCGKTLLAEAAAYSLALTHGKQAMRSGFIYIKGPELLGKYVGESEERLRAQFVKGEKHFEEHGYPALMFIDEAEALFKARGSGISSDITDNMVTTFLSEMSGLNASHIMVLLATNTPKMLDSAVLRDGRCDRHIKVPRPTMEVVPDIFDIYFDDIPLADGFDEEQAIGMATAEVFSHRLAIYHVSNGTGAIQAKAFTLADAVNGAMVKGIVGKATSLAMKRDMREGTLTGIHPHELRCAVHATYVQNRDINHDLNLIDFAERNGMDAEHLNVVPAPMPQMLAEARQ